MTHDLLSLADHEPPMGDLFTRRRLDVVRAVWVRPLPGEKDVPKKRIVHQRVVRLHGRAKLRRIGLRRGQGYHKCGSRQDLDWVAGFRVLVHRDGRWREVLRRDGLAADAPGVVRWLRLPAVVTDGVIVEVRRSGIDGGWTSWNLTMSAFLLEGELLDRIAPRCERLLEVRGVDLSRLPAGVEAVRADGAVVYRTADFTVGFALTRPGWTQLGLAIEDRRRGDVNLLSVRPPEFSQGTQLHLLGRAPAIAPSVRCALEGTATVQGNRVVYDFETDGQRHRLAWTVTSGGLVLRARRTTRKAVLAWHSSVWTIGLRNSASPSHVLGRLRKTGETGALELPALLTLPGFGSWRIAGTGGAGWLRSDCHRAHDLNTLEFKVGERPTREGLYRVPAGTQAATFRLTPARPSLRLRTGAPAVVRRALERTLWTALTFRADTATLSNSGASMHCPICMDTWAAVTRWQGTVLPGLPAAEFLRHSLERWLTGGPGYAAGRLLQEATAHDADDEYLQTGASALRGLGEYVRRFATPAWYREFRPRIRDRIEAARARDLDGDGLIESPHRTGVSGTSQWSTCWYDVISFGWKDAFANAILYGALRELAAGLRRFGDTGRAAELLSWADWLRTHYRPTFWNTDTGWFAGWRCRENVLHDYAFLAVNGAAVSEGLLEPDEGRAVLQRLLAEAHKAGLPDPALGLPGNLRPIPDRDLADIAQGYPFGYYQNGGRTHAQARHLINALYRCGLEAEADALLLRLGAGLAEARVFGGNQSGVDWRHWDDRPCGYEGLLTDQFGVIEPLLWRWGRVREGGRGRRGISVRSHPS